MRKTFVFIILILLSLVYGCSDDTSELANDIVVVDSDNTLIERYAGYYRVSCQRSASDNGSEINLECSSDWLHLMSDSLLDDGLVEFYADENIDVESRDAVITLGIVGDNPLSITIKQKGLGDYDENADDDKLSDFRVGWGFNAFLDYKSAKSIQQKIIDPSKLKSWDNDSSFISVQEVVRAIETFDTETALSIVEMASQLTEKQSNTKNFLGVRKTTNRFTKICNKDLSEQSVGYARLQKVVAQRSIDAGALRYIIENSSVNKMPFTADFLELYKRICKNRNDKEAINDMLDKYGTHVIINASAGGCIDFLVSFNRNETSEIREVIEEKCKNMFGYSTQSYSGEKTINATSDIRNENSFAISGGSEETVRALRSTISNMTSTSQLSTSEIQNWLASITYSAIDTKNRNSLDIIDFDFIPIWELFTDQATSAAVQNAVMEMSNMSTNKFPADALGTDNYHLILSDINKDEGWLDFSISKVKVLYNDKEPIIEMCQEYVPKIRTDRPICVYYPIFNRRTKISQGIFPGDGEGNKPAYLTFSGSDCYVNPIEGYTHNDTLNTIYYLHGNLYAENYGLRTNEIQKEKSYVYWDVKTLGCGIVKIGSGYWTSDIKNNMHFGYTSFGEFQEHEHIINNKLYANIYGSNDPKFYNVYNIGKIYGSDIDETFKMRTKWYLPLVSDIESMLAYLDRNMKPLFPNQQTGFNASFSGYYGTYDIYGNYTNDDNMKIYMADSCFIAAKNDLSAVEGKVLMITPNYTYKILTAKREQSNEYPVRLFRTNYYKYNKYSNFPWNKY